METLILAGMVVFRCTSQGAYLTPCRCMMRQGLDPDRSSIRSGLLRASTTLEYCRSGRCVLGRLVRRKWGADC